MEDKSVLAENTHLTMQECDILLTNRTLTGDPRQHDHPAIILTEDEVVVETGSAFSNSGTKSSIEVALTSGAKVDSVRQGDSAFTGDYHLKGSDEE